MERARDSATPAQNQKLVLAARPRELPEPGDFRLESEALAPLEEGRVPLLAI